MGGRETFWLMIFVDLGFILIELYFMDFLDPLELLDFLEFCEKFYLLLKLY